MASESERMTKARTLHIRGKAWELLKIAAARRHSTMSELASQVLENTLQEN